MADDVILEAEEPLTLRDALLSAVKEHTGDDETVTATVPNKPDRVRDESGKFAKQEKPAEVVTATEPVAPVEPQRPPKPSSWKKELDEHWQKADPKLAEYIVQREREYATGVSTYRQEAERAKELQQAIEPFIPELQRHNINPSQWIQNLGHAHQTLAMGNPQQKMAMFSRLAQDYGIDLNQLAQIDPRQLQLVQPPQRPAFDPAMMRQEVVNILTEREIVSEIEKMRADATTYPHFETVRETMTGLLQSGLAQDLKGAYDKALRMHDDLFEAQQAERQKQSEAERLAKQAEAAKSARAKTLSPRSSTPSGQAGNAAAKGRRELLAEQFASGAGRV